jgi:hypothetical protein
MGLNLQISFLCEELNFFFFLVGISLPKINKMGLNLSNPENLVIICDNTITKEISDHIGILFE